MPSLPTVTEIASDATWLVQATDANSGLVRIVRMDAEAYRAASFLDDRMLTQPRETAVLSWADVVAAAPALQRNDARWIFHIGHVGSTLISRLLGELSDVLSIREPRILRDLAVVAADKRRGFAQYIQPLFSRTFAPNESALVKATSFVSEIAPELVPPGQRALFLYATPRAYIASILAGENSVKEMAALASSRAERVAARASLAQPTNAAETAALAWACEITAIEKAAEAIPNEYVEWLDFDHFLADVPGMLGRAAKFFEFDADLARIEEIASGPLIRRYSKALEYDYSPSLRRDLIANAEAANRADIDRALVMLQSAAENSPLLARALDRAKEH